MIQECLSVDGRLPAWVSVFSLAPLLPLILSRLPSLRLFFSYFNLDFFSTIFIFAPATLTESPWPTVTQTWPDKFLISHLHAKNKIYIVVLVKAFRSFSPNRHADRHRQTQQKTLISCIKVTWRRLVECEQRSYSLQWAGQNFLYPTCLPFAVGGLGPSSNTMYLGSPKVSTPIGPRPVQPFLHSTVAWQTDRQGGSQLDPDTTR